MDPVPPQSPAPTTPQLGGASGAAGLTSGASGQGGLVGPDGERFIWVMDPMTRKLKVPLSVIDPTQATATPGTVPSLCMLFLDGRCKHPACRQVHVSLPVLQQLRKDAQHAPSCCSIHGDLRENSVLVSNFALVSVVGNQGGGNSPLPTPGSNSPVPLEAIPPALPPPLYQQQGGTAPDSPAPTTPELNGALYPPLPGSTPSSTPPPTTWSPQAKPASVPSGAAASAPAASPSQPNQVVHFTIPSNRVAMTVGLQRFLAQSGYLGKSSTPIPGNSPVDGSHPQPPPPETSVLLPAGKENSTLEIPLKMICRLHLSHKCRYLEDCNNVHVCREMESKLPASSGNHPALGPQHCQDVLQSLRPKLTTSTTVGNMVYSVKLISAGQISDTDMHQIVQSHKLQQPSVQLRIVDVRASTNPGSNSSSMLPQAMDHHEGAPGTSSQQAAPPAIVSPTQQPQTTFLFKAPGAPVSSQSSPPGPSRAPQNPGVTSQFAGSGISPLLQGAPDPPPPPSMEAAQPGQHQAVGGFVVGGADEPPVMGGPSWAF